MNTKEKIEKINNINLKILETENQLKEMKEELCDNVRKSNLLFSELIKTIEGWKLIAALFKKENNSMSCLKELLNVYFENDDFLSKNLNRKYSLINYPLNEGDLAFLILNKEQINRRTYQEIIENYKVLNIDFLNIEFSVREPDSDEISIVLNGKDVWYNDQYIENTPVKLEIEKVDSEIFKNKCFKK